MLEYWNRIWLQGWGKNTARSYTLLKHSSFLGEATGFHIFMIFDRTHIKLKRTVSCKS